MEVIIKIKEIRRQRGYSQSFVAKRLNISQRAYSKIELNETSLNWKKMEKIAQVLNIGVWEILDIKKSVKSNADNEVKKPEPQDNQQKKIHELEEKVAQLESNLIKFRKVNKKKTSPLH